MALVIYQLAHSPFCIPVTNALRACGAAFTTVEVPNWNRAEIIRLTAGAYYQVPLLVHEGKAVFEDASDSQRIAHYIDRLFADGRLFPVQWAGLHELVLQHLENEVEGVTFRLVDPFYVEHIEDLVGRTMTRRHKERRFGAGCLEQWRENASALRQQAEQVLQPYELMLQEKPFLFGKAPIYADFLLFGILGNMTWKGWNRLFPSQPKLQA